MEFLKTIQENQDAAIIAAVTSLIALFIAFQGLTSIVRAFKGRKPEKSKPAVIVDIKKNEQN